jgi:hypothetical protein
MINFRIKKLSTLFLYPIILTVFIILTIIAVELYRAERTFSQVNVFDLMQPFIGGGQLLVQRCIEIGVGEEAPNCGLENAIVSDVVGEFVKLADCLRLPEGKSRQSRCQRDTAAYATKRLCAREVAPVKSSTEEVVGTGLQDASEEVE